MGNSKVKKKCIECCFEVTVVEVKTPRTSRRTSRANSRASVCRTPVQQVVRPRPYYLGFTFNNKHIFLGHCI